MLPPTQELSLFDQQPDITGDLAFLGRVEHAEQPTPSFQLDMETSLQASGSWVELGSGDAPCPPPGPLGILPLHGK